MSNLTLLILLKLAYLAAGVALCFIGKRLVEKGYQTKFEGEGAVSSTSVKLVTTSPGLVFLLAGLTVIGIAIFQKSQLSESFRNQGQTPVTPAATAAPHLEAPQKSQGPASNSAGKTDLVMLVEKTQTISFASESDDLRLAQTSLRRARKLITQGKVDEAVIPLSVAVILDPSVLRTITSDSAYSQALEQPQFQAIAEARFKLPIAVVEIPSAALSSAAQEILSRLQTLAAREPEQNPKQVEARRLAASLTDNGSTESAAVTTAKLVRILDMSPRVLLDKLQRSDSRWILTRPGIANELENQIDRKIQAD